MGGADVVPGVSGGTIAFITGIYERLVGAIKNVDLQFVRLVFKGQIAQAWKHIDGTFLIVLFSGIVISVFSLVRVIHYLLEAYPIQLWAFFFGLIVISAVLVARQNKQWNAINFLGLLAGTAAAWLITSATPSQTPNDLWFVFLAGAIAICAMILPGISGAFILLILGKYAYIFGAIKDFKVDVALVFVLGCLTGLLSFARLLSWLLKHHWNLVVAVLSGFMLGSLNKVWPWKVALTYRINSAGEQVPLVEKNVLPTDYLAETGNEPYFLQSLLFAALGILIVAAIEKVAQLSRSARA